jgi:hypothetical protein
MKRPRAGDGHAGRSTRRWLHGIGNVWQVHPESQGASRFAVLADHYQFYLQDLDAHMQWMRSDGIDPVLTAAGWTREASQFHRVAVEPHSLSVGTARDDTVETTLRIHLNEPHSRAQDAEHIVEADIDLPNGDIAIYGPADDPAHEQHVSIPPGLHRARVSYVPTRPPAEASDVGYGNYFIYQVDLWPTSKPAPLAVLKQGPNPWAG